MLTTAPSSMQVQELLKLISQGEWAWHSGEWEFLIKDMSSKVIIIIIIIIIIILLLLLLLFIYFF